MIERFARDARLSTYAPAMDAPSAAQIVAAGRIGGGLRKRRTGFRGGGGHARRPCRAGEDDAVVGHILEARIPEHVEEHRAGDNRLLARHRVAQAEVALLAEAEVAGDAVLPVAGAQLLPEVEVVAEDVEGVRILEDALIAVAGAKAERDTGGPSAGRVRRARSRARRGAAGSGWSRRSAASP